MKRIALACCGLLLSASAMADTLTLNQALHAAEGHSPQVQKAEAISDEAYWHKVENGSTFLPKITAGAQYLSDYKYVWTDLQFNGLPVSFPGIVPTTIYSLNADYEVFDGFAGTNRFRAARAQESAARQELDWARFQTSRQVTLQFYRALAAKTLHAVSEANLKTLEDHLHDATQLKRSGLSTNYDVLRVDVQVSEARSDLMNSTDDIETANGDLAQLLGLEKIAEPQGTLPELPENLADKVSTNINQRPDVSALISRTEANRLESIATLSHWVPRVNIFGEYEYYNNRNDEFDDWKNFRNAYEIGVRLNWNLFDGFADHAKNREAVDRSIETQKTLRMTQLKASQDVALWKRKFRYFNSVYRSRQSDIGKAKEAVRLAREGRRVGSRTNTELLDAETDLHRAQAGAIHAQLGVIEALINLELATGQKLYEFN